MAELAQEILFQAAELEEVTPLCTHAFFQIFPGQAACFRQGSSRAQLHRAWGRMQPYSLQAEASSLQSWHLFVVGSSF